MKKELLIPLLQLEPLGVEGGFFQRTYTAQGGAASAIYYLLGPGDRSEWHRVNHADELWFAHGDTSARQVILAPDGGEWQVRTLGLDVAAGELPQALVRAGWWQTTVLTKPGTALFSTVVVPEFRYEDFEGATVELLQARFPALPWARITGAATP